MNKILKFIKFIKILIKKASENELMLMSNALTYKLLIAMFPFIIFLMTLLGFYNLNLEEYIIEASKTLPKPIENILIVFLEEVIQTKSVSLLSTSFLITIYSASTGFNSIIQGLNRAYEQEDNRSFILKRGTSVMLVFIFAILVNFSLLLFIFSDYIRDLIIKYTPLEFIPYFLDSAFLYILVGLVLLVMVLVIYKISISRNVTLKSILPGALISVFSWLILSKGFNIYINNFSRYSKIYGSIGSIFVLVIWINMISLVLLLGGQINAILEKQKVFKS
ncbi:YihY/virulence factor BrkB family protein [uncultured Tyzzerella sp.]|uniref:YihY/virulence factor BrkB family protein n=1 Tax=uncultured Tyzzerella sp. TaxID=2321398 RepID=UPI002941EE8F|nr:YihY/virulence factor BrkB family protein [uncultured Tyzzerella sp.]